MPLSLPGVFLDYGAGTLMVVSTMVTEAYRPIRRPSMTAWATLPTVETTTPSCAITVPAKVQEPGALIVAAETTCQHTFFGSTGQGPARITVCRPGPRPAVGPPTVRLEAIWNTNTSVAEPKSVRSEPTI